MADFLSSLGSGILKSLPGLAGSAVSGLIQGGIAGAATPSLGSLRDFAAQSSFGNLSSPSFNASTSSIGGIPTINVGLTPAITDRLNSLSTGANQAVGGFTDLLSGLKPGFGLVTSARTNAVNDARDRAIGDLRSNLALRRLSGSSFANDALARADAEFGRAQGDARAQSFLEELNTNAQLLDRRFSVASQTILNQLNQLNLGAELGQQILTGTRQAFQRSFDTAQQLAQQGVAARVNQFSGLTAAAGNAVAGALQNIKF